MLFANYAWLNQQTDADGVFSVPVNSYDLSNEWGPVVGVPRHNLSAMQSTPIPGGVRLALNGGYRSGTPYNITTGFDDNGDTVFNDRPAGLARNAGRTASSFDIGGRLSYAFGFGQRQAGGTGTGGIQTPVMIVQRVGGASGGGDIAGMFGGGAEDKRIRFELFVSGSNLLNTVNHVGYSGVQTSPFFGQPTAAMPGRKIDVGMRVGF
jgi:hypothetical protein